MVFDEIDCRILNVLQRDGRISNQDLADQVGLSPSPCLRRMRQLESAGVIQRYVALVDLAAVGDVPGVTINRFCASSIDAVAQAAARIRGDDLELVAAGGWRACPGCRCSPTAGRARERRGG